MIPVYPEMKQRIPDACKGRIPYYTFIISIYVEECGRIGYKAEAVKDLAKLQHDLRSISLNPHKLQEQTSEIRDLETRVKNLKGEIASYKRDLERLRKSRG